MPRKDPKSYAAYMKIYMKNRRTKVSLVNPIEKWKFNLSKLNEQFVCRAAFPRHVYEMRLSFDALKCFKFYK